jgi:hypothetical protein
MGTDYLKSFQKVIDLSKDIDFILRQMGEDGATAHEILAMLSLKHTHISQRTVDRILRAMRDTVIRVNHKFYSKEKGNAVQS